MCGGLWIAASLRDLDLCFVCLLFKLKLKKKDTLSGRKSEHKVCLDKGEALLLYNSLAGRASSPRKGKSWA